MPEPPTMFRELMLLAGNMPFTILPAIVAVVARGEGHVLLQVLLLLL